MQRGDIYWVDFDPSQGSEANKTRPAVIVSNNAANHASERTGRGVITVVPITSNVTRIYPFQVFFPAENTGLSSDSKAQCEQVRAITPDRLAGRIGRISATLMLHLDEALRVHLAL